MNRLHVYSFRRSGTNLFASCMNRHPAVLSLNCGGGKFMDMPKDPLEEQDRWLFLNGVNFNKNASDLEYVLFDEVRPANYGRYNEHKTIALLRKRSSINRSIDRVNKIYKKAIGRAWTPHISVEQYSQLEEIACSNNCFAISFESFIHNQDRYLIAISRFLGIDAFPSQEEALGYGCICGGHFDDNQVVHQIPNEPQFMKYDPPRNYLSCNKCGKILSAAGGCNPAASIDISKAKEEESFFHVNSKFNNDSRLWEDLL